MEKLRIGLIGLVAAVAGFTLQACVIPQGDPECTVVGSQGAFGVTPYWAQTKETSRTGTGCPDLEDLLVGMQRWSQPDGGSSPYRVAVRPARLTDMWNGEDYLGDPAFPLANTDPTNDCANEQDCDICVVTLGDGGMVLGADPTIVVIAGEAQLADGGTLPVDDTNECGVVDDVVYREDPADPTGRGVIGEASFATQFPDKDGICSLENFTPAKQDFAAVDTYNADGTPGTPLPAMPVSYDWTEFKVVSTTKVPGTAFTAKLKLTEGACVVDYDVLAFWPIVGCETDMDCNPLADLDAGHAFGSGINPEFKPTCKTGLTASGATAWLDGYWGTSGVCVPSVDLTTLK